MSYLKQEILQTQGEERVCQVWYGHFSHFTPLQFSRDLIASLYPCDTTISPRWRKLVI